MPGNQKKSKAAGSAGNLWNYHYQKEKVSNNIARVHLKKLCKACLWLACLMTLLKPQEQPSNEKDNWSQVGS